MLEAHAAKPQRRARSERLPNKPARFSAWVCQILVCQTDFFSLPLFSKSEVRGEISHPPGDLWFYRRHHC